MFNDEENKIIVKHTLISVGMISFQFFSEAISCSRHPPQFVASLKWYGRFRAEADILAHRRRGAYFEKGEPEKTQGKTCIGCPPGCHQTRFRIGRCQGKKMTSPSAACKKLSVGNTRKRPRKRGAASRRPSI